MDKVPVRVTFAGGIHTTTGSNFLVQTPETSVLVDCGLFQGQHIAEEDKNREEFMYDPGDVSVLFVTHAHLDHVGRIPVLVKRGFSGKIYSTPATKDIAELILTDSMRVFGKEAEEMGQEPLYAKEDVERAMELWEVVPYHEEMEAGTDIKARFLDAGHILGSAMVVFQINGKKLLFTGDLGNTPTPILRDTEEFDDVTCIVTESVYGDRNHEDKEERQGMLRETIIDTIERGGVLMVPAFSIERTQELLFEINHLVENKLIPPVPIFLDSPLAIKVTEVYKRYEHLYNTDAQEIIKSGDDIFNFSLLRNTLSSRESKAINDLPGPKIILAGSGMSNGGRILHHEKRYLGDPKSTLLIVGFQAVGTLGRLIQDGAKTVDIHGVRVRVKARVKTIRGYSAHKDSDNLLAFIDQANSAGALKKVFVVLGEPRSSLFLAQKIRDYLDVDATTPAAGETIDLLF